MPRRRYQHRRTSRPPFRSWGLLLTFLLLFTLFFKLWIAAFVAAATLSFYLLAVRVVPCRVEKVKGGPCGWRVRGIMSTCDYHTGLKRGLPKLQRHGTFGIPQIIWLRTNPGTTDAFALDPSPNSTTDIATLAPNQQNSPGKEKAMLWLTVAGVLVALISLIRDFVAS